MINNIIMKGNVVCYFLAGADTLFTSAVTFTVRK